MADLHNAQHHRQIQPYRPSQKASSKESHRDEPIPPAKIVSYHVICSFLLAHTDADVYSSIDATTKKSRNRCNIMVVRALKLNEAIREISRFVKSHECMCEISQRQEAQTI
jgi:hypothetical protein